MRATRGMSSMRGETCVCSIGDIAGTLDIHHLDATGDMSGVSE